MARPSKHDGVIYRRKDSKIWWMRYRDKSGERRLESTGTEDWHEAQRQLRERLQARDNNTLDIVRKGEQLLFSDWAAYFLENFSRPPVRAPKTHEANENALKTLVAAFGPKKLAEIDSTGNRIAPPPAASAAAANSADFRSCRGRKAEARNGPSGVSRAPASVQRGGQEEAVCLEPMRRC